MTLPTIVSRDEWLIARKAFLAKEKDFTKARDALNAERRSLPMVKIEKDYTFDGSSGKASLLDLFEGRRQLIIYYFMYLREKNEGCPGCSNFTDNIPHLSRIHARARTLALVSRAPLTEIEPFKARMGWTVPWFGSLGSDFNYDFHATTDEAKLTPLVAKVNQLVEKLNALGTNAINIAVAPVDLETERRRLRERLGERLKQP